ncbi:RNA polymerase sigma-70 factor (ECF subfamily) [Leifsonia sp. AK011]|uniref:RNA polymerase sigma factor n=1 Tax=Leifsonia sp. AK011 TaxID=2723075 RepID=UPI0015C91BCD|nr:sigma-70 family RNA polymerase sigma factor [Leifsonia sp. AK011]NYF08894.1 RNA polymerase sigma-70 factor (ECF subfamily) [Leifsonia sp. AK011]
MTDETDWAAAAAGDGEAFGRVFDRHRDRVVRHSIRLVPTPTDADDVVAITFLEAWRRRDRVRFVDGSALPWLLVTATNSARNLSRTARRYRALLARLPASDATPDHAERFDDSTAVAALRSLSAADRQIVTLCILEGFSEREAAEALGVPQGTVKSRLSRAKKRLAERIAAPALARSRESES